MDTVLFFLHSGLVLAFGVLTCISFAGIRLNARNMLKCSGLLLFCATLQLVCFLNLSEELVWKLYPLVTHLPCVLFLCLFYRKNPVTALVSVFTAYLCCQPAKWFGILAHAIFGSISAEYIARCLCLIGTSAVCLLLLAPYLSSIFNKSRRSVCIFGILPAIYYIFDYIVVVYTSIWMDNNQVAIEFLPFILCITFLIFCLVYYREYEQKADAERKEQLIRITAEQQAHEMEVVRQNEQSLRLMRHDMRHFLNSLALCIRDGDQEKALKMIATYTTHIEGIPVNRYCGCEIVNYVLSDFAVKCAAQSIKFSYDIGLDTIEKDETLFCSILHNGLENAFNAQLLLPHEKRCVHLLLKTMNNKLLLAVKNPVEQIPVFSDGLPISTKPGHGYGTQSIRYMTERLGGNCQFTVQNGLFIMRVIL